jgi:hypothetical protein
VTPVCAENGTPAKSLKHSLGLRPHRYLIHDLLGGLHVTMCEFRFSLHQDLRLDRLGGHTQEAAYRAKRRMPGDERKLFDPSI